MSERWHQVWSERSDGGHAALLTRLMHADGYLSGFSPSSEASFRRFVAAVMTRTGMAPGESVFEIGCGAGAFLLPLVEAGLEVGGLDYAAAQVELARASLPGDRWVTAEASDYDAQPVDHVVSNGVFLYFPDLDYAERVLVKAMGAARRSIAILDTPDVATRDASEAYRRNTMGEDEYREAYAGLEHLYFERDWFARLADEHDWDCFVEDQDLEGHPQARFRFNAFLTRA